jgi:exodeoxyribonuclease III
MRLISFNVNGIRSMTGKIKNGEKKGSATNNVIKTLIDEQKPDILCFQEIKTQNEGDLAFLKSNFKYILTNFSKFKKGYSGVAMLTNTKPQWISYDFKMYSEEQIGPYNSYEWIDEGRIITARFNNCIVVTAYIPNAQSELTRLEERVIWEEIMRKYLKLLKDENNVSVIYVGDLNVAPEDIDIHDKKNRDKVAGASKEERAEYKKLLEVGFVNAFRYLYPNERKYTYFSNFANARQNGKGWNIDHWIVSDEAKDKILRSDMLQEYFGSDHIPILLDINI